MKKIACFIVFLSIVLQLFAQAQSKKISLEIIVDSTPLSKPISDSIMISYINRERMPWQERKYEPRGRNNFKWMIQTDEPVICSWDIATNNQLKQFMLEPGDSIVVHYKDGIAKFTGKGSEKLILKNELASLPNTLQSPTNEKLFETLSLQDYLEWKSYLNRQWEFAEVLINSYHRKISPLAMNYVKVSFLQNYEYQLTWKFLNLRLLEGQVSKASLNKVFDEDFYSPHMRWLRSQTTSLVGEHSIFGFNRLEVAKADSFLVGHRRPTESRESFALRLYENGLKNYQGNALEFALADFLTTYVFKEIQFSTFTDSLLERYYHDASRAPLFKAYVKRRELEARILKKGKRVPEFVLADQNKKTYTKADLKGQAVVFWFYKGDGKPFKLMKEIEHKFDKDPFVKFFRVPQSNAEPDIARTFNVTRYPAFFVINLTGVLVGSSFIDSTITVSQLQELIAKHSGIARIEDWQEKNDGPYIHYHAGLPTSFQIMNGRLSTSGAAAKTIRVAGDEPGSYFNIALRNNYAIEPSVFSKPEKLFAFSDIEGELKALRALLENNGVINKSGDWVFGKGHLVFAGDMFDRGEQVTECLWLLYALEEKAKAAGGYVHFILGNHEIMNFEGNHKYTKSKYKTSAEKIGKSLVELYSANSELGRWLRTKNIVEKIGDILFMHAGISKEVNDLGLTVQQINELARPYYDRSNTAIQSGNKALGLLFDTQLSPFWYRDYYLSSEMTIGLAHNKQIIKYKAPESLIDSVRLKFGVNRIVTGHTVFGGAMPMEDRGRFITVHYDGKVINTDTRHAEGKSEALLIEGDKFYRVNDKGERVLLFVDDKRTLPATTSQN